MTTWLTFQYFLLTGRIEHEPVFSFATKVALAQIMEGSANGCLTKLGKPKSMVLSCPQSCRTSAKGAKMACSVKAHATVDGHAQRVLEFHRVCSRATLDKVNIEEASSKAVLRLKALAALLLEEIVAIQNIPREYPHSVHGGVEAETAYEQVYSAYLHAMSALSRSSSPAEEQNVEALPVSA
jgi:hypothetical protein